MYSPMLFLLCSLYLLNMGAGEFGPTSDHNMFDAIEGLDSIRHAVVDLCSLQSCLVINEMSFYCSTSALSACDCARQ